MSVVIDSIYKGKFVTNKKSGEVVQVHFEVKGTFIRKDKKQDFKMEIILKGEKLKARFEEGWTTPEILFSEFDEIVEIQQEIIEKSTKLILEYAKDKVNEHLPEDGTIIH